MSYLDNPYYNEGMGEGSWDRYDDSYGEESNPTWWQDDVNEKWNSMLAEADKHEGRWQAVYYECGRPTSCLKRGTFKECCYAALAEELGFNSSYERERCYVQVMTVNLDENGDEDSFLAMREEYDHCWEMGDFDYDEW